MSDICEILDEEFDKKLIALLKEEPIEYILQIPGVYEILAKHYNNTIIDEWKAEQQTDDEE